MQIKTDLINQTSNKIGLKINEKKTKIMIVQRDKFQDMKINVNNNGLENVEDFTYLGSKISNDGNSQREINIRISKAAGAMKQLSNIWKDTNISNKTKLKLYRTNVVSTLLYGCETWQVTTKQEKILDIFDNRCMRRILKVNWQDYVSNKQLREKYEHPPVSAIMK